MRLLKTGFLPLTLMIIGGYGFRGQAPDGRIVTEGARQLMDRTGDAPHLVFVTHSVPEGFATAWHTAQGVVLHSGDHEPSRRRLILTLKNRAQPRQPQHDDQPGQPLNEKDRDDALPR